MIDLHDNTDCGVYGYFYNNTKDFGDLTALKYYGKSISYEKMFKKIDTVARCLVGVGVKKGDVVVVSLPSIPEAVCLFYAINKIGAVYCGMDCRSTSKEIADTLKMVSPKICFVSDFHIKEFKDCVRVPIVYIRATESIGGVTRLFEAFANFFTGRFFVTRKMDNVFKYRQFCCDSTASLKAIETKGEDICAYFYTSGTTYGRKCVVLTNKNINSAVLQHGNAEVEMSKGDIFTNFMPLFTCYGVTLGTHLPLNLGICVNLVPLFFGKNMKKILIKSKSNFIITVPAHWEYFRRDKFDRCDLSFFKAAIVGGDCMPYEHENEIKKIFEKCGSKGRLMIGYGLTETTSTAVSPPVQTPQGSIGKAMKGTDVRIFQIGTDKECRSMEKGEICISGPTVCKGYLNDSEATKKLLRIHTDGKLWLHSGDIGYMDNEGYIYFCERIKRMFVRFDGTKISPYSIEQVLLKCSVVSRCLILAVDDKSHSQGKCAKAMVVLKNDDASSRKIYEKYIAENLAEYMRPVYTEYVSSLPVTRNGKIDYFSQ